MVCELRGSRDCATELLNQEPLEPIEHFPGFQLALGQSQIIWKKVSET